MMRATLKITMQNGVTFVERECAFNALPSVLREIANGLIEPVTPSDTRMAIVAAMRKRVIATGATELAADLNTSENNVAQHLRRMVKNGTARKLAYGRYLLNGKASAALSGGDEGGTECATEDGTG